MNIAADGPIPLAAASAFLCRSSHFALLQSGRLRRRRRRQFCRAAAAAAFSQAENRQAAAFQLSMSLSPSFRSAKKTQKPLLYSGLTGFTPLCTVKLFRTSQPAPRFHEKTARKTLVSNCSRKPFCYYYIVLHTTTHSTT